MVNTIARTVEISVVNKGFPLRFISKKTVDLKFAPLPKEWMSTSFP